MHKKRLSSAALKAVLNKYIQGTATPEEVQQVEHWYNNFKEEELPHTTAEKEVLRKELMSGIMRQVPVKRTWWKVAAAAAVITAACFLLLRKETPAPVLLASKQVSTPAACRKAITLSDGTVIHLNAGTELTIPGDYGVHERRLILSGEAFFEVATDAARPFIINSGNLQTTVLGTSFNIRAYKELPVMTVAVASGKVKITDTLTHQSLSDSLTANRELSYDIQTSLASIGDLPDGMSGAWRNNIFYFNNSTLAEIGGELERQYNIPVTVKGEGSNKGHYKISFIQEPLSKVLKVLAGLTGITYTIKQNEVIIYTKAH